MEVMLKCSHPLISERAERPTGGKIFRKSLLPIVSQGTTDVTPLFMLQRSVFSRRDFWNDLSSCRDLKPSYSTRLWHYSNKAGIR